MNLKISRVRHVIITSIIFLIIIAIIVAVYNAQLNAIPDNAKTMVYRIVAKKDIEPGTKLTSNNVERKEVQDVLEINNLLYRLEKNDTNKERVKSVDSNGKAIATEKTAQYDVWAVGKIATEKIYKGEVINANQLKNESNFYNGNERLYSVPFESSTTGGYNIKLGEEVDLCVLYNEDSDEIKTYQKLPDNKAIDIVLAKKMIIDIRDESGNSAANNAAVVPGYVCFKLTYDEINKLEIAKRQGTIFVGKVGDYLGNAHNETFMSGIQMPTI